MSGRDSVKSLLVLRKLTRAIADAVRAQLTEYLVTLTPLLQPQGVFGDYIQGTQREPSPKADLAFKDLKALYDAVAPAKPLNLRRELSTTFQLQQPESGRHAAGLRPCGADRVGQQKDHRAIAADMDTDVRVDSRRSVCRRSLDQQRPRRRASAVHSSAIS